MSLQPDQLVALLPFVLPVALLAYIIMATVAGSLLRRKRRQDHAALREKDPRLPWHRWLDEINRQQDRERKSGAIEKWRE